MAIDTLNEKLALISFYKPYGVPIPTPDTEFSQGDLQHLVWDYPGILWTASGLDYVHIFGTSSYVTPVYISDSGQNVLIEGSIEIQADCYIQDDLQVLGDISCANLAASEVVTDYGFFHDRGDPAALDWDVDDFIKDGPVGNYSNAYWHDLDCSAIVPTDAKAIVFTVSVASLTIGAYFALRKNSNLNYQNSGWVGTIVSSIWSMGGHLIIPCDSDRKVEYWCRNVTWIGINVTIVGWLK